MILVSHIIANRPAPYLLDASMSATEAARFLAEHHIGGAPVIKNKLLVGFCSERDIVYRVVAKGRNPEETEVAEIMSKNVILANPEDTVVECEEKMHAEHVRHMPVVAEGHVIACISLRNLLQSELGEYQFEVEQLTEYIRGT